MLCPRCGRTNDAEARFCAGCGSQLYAVGAAQPAVAAEGPDALYRAVIGSNQEYYLERFRRFDRDGGAGAGWHWPALFVTFFWLVYRKMWGVAAAYVLIVCVSYMVLPGVGAMVAGAVGGFAMFGLHLLAVLLVPPLMANALYYRHCRRQIALTEGLASNPQARVQELFRRGGTSPVAAGIAAVVFGLGGAMLLFIVLAVSVPAYRDYLGRSQVAEAEATARAAGAAVGEFHHRHQRVPASLAEAGFSAGTAPASVRDIRVDGETGVVSVTLDAEPVAGQTLLLVPALQADGQVGWTCTSHDIDRRHLPADCRPPH